MLEYRCHQPSSNTEPVLLADEGGEAQYVTVLEIPPVDSAETAVKVAIAAKGMQR